MTHASSSESALQQQFLRDLQRFWPAIKGSLSQVHKPCIRPHCPACARGDKHPAFLLSFTEKGRRRCMYVPAAWVPRLRHALDNGQQLEPLLSELAPALLRLYRQQRDTASRP